MRRAAATYCHPDSGGGAQEPRGQAMTDDDITTMDDPQFLDERRRVREELEHLCAGEVSDTLAARYQMLNEEFLRRARIAWSPTSWEAAQ
jgi:hypothetical protein